MNDPSPELEQQVRAAFARLKPGRLFRGCKVAELSKGLIVRIYSHVAEYPELKPTPYEVMRFDAAAGTLTLLSAEEAAPYFIRPYK